jgi:hypothetical protein
MLLVEHTHAGSREEAQLGTVSLLIHFLPHAMVVMNQPMGNPVHEIGEISLQGMSEENAAAGPLSSSAGNDSKLLAVLVGISPDVVFYQHS